MFTDRANEIRLVLCERENCRTGKLFQGIDGTENNVVHAFRASNQLQDGRGHRSSPVLHDGGVQPSMATVGIELPQLLTKIGHPALLFTERGRETEDAMPDSNYHYLKRNTFRKRSWTHTSHLFISCLCCGMSTGFVNSITTLCGIICILSAALCSVFVLHSQGYKLLLLFQQS